MINIAIGGIKRTKKLAKIKGALRRGVVDYLSDLFKIGRLNQNYLYNGTRQVYLYTVSIGVT